MLNLSCSIVSLQVLLRFLAFHTSRDEFVAQQETFVAGRINAARSLVDLFVKDSRQVAKRV